MADLEKLLRPNPFAGDTGQRSQVVLDALKIEGLKRPTALLAALERIFLPIFPHLHPGFTAEGKVAHHERQPDPLADDDGLFQPVFLGGKMAIEIYSDAPTLLAMHPTARPVPLYVKEVARTALARGTGLLVLDRGTAHELYIGRSATLALATANTWLPPWQDEQIKTQLQQGLEQILQKLEILLPVELQILARENGVTVLNLHFAPSASLRLGQEDVVDRVWSVEQIQRVVTELLRIIQEQEYLRLRLDAVELQIN